MCQLAQISRANFYRSLEAHQPLDKEMAVRSAIQHLALAHRRRYDYRRIIAELRDAVLVNHKRVVRLMREDNLLAVQARAFVVTADTQHDLEVYLNLASRLTLTGINQLWVADITYNRLRTEFVYLAVILDRFSHRVVGWTMERPLASRLPLEALHHATIARQTPPGLMHHSDRGVQYASGKYVQVLRQHQMIPSMNCPANPYDNACNERFTKTLKREEIHAHTYRGRRHLRTNIIAFIEQYYHCARLHSALDYRAPEEFERTVAARDTCEAATMHFFRPASV